MTPFAAALARYSGLQLFADGCLISFQLWEVTEGSVNTVQRTSLVLTLSGK